MKTFFFTTLFRLIALIAGSIYLYNFQSELLYSTLGATSPMTEAMNTCMSGMDSLSSGLNSKLDTILMRLDDTKMINANGAITIDTVSTVDTTSTISDNSTGSVKIIDNSTATKN